MICPRCKRPSEKHSEFDSICDFLPRQVNYVAELVSQVLTDALHPEFGTEWREPDGVIYRAVRQARQDALREAAAFINSPKFPRGRGDWLDGCCDAIEAIEALADRMNDD